MAGKGEGVPGLGVRELLLRLLRPHLPALLLVLAMMTAQSLVVLLQPWLAGKLSVRLLQGGTTATLLWILFGLITAQAGLGYLMNLRLQAVSGTLVSEAGSRLYGHLQALPLGWHQERRRGDVLALLTGDVARLAGYLTRTMLPLLPALLTFFGALAMMVTMAPAIAAVIALLVPMFFFILKVLGRGLRPLGHAAVQAWADQSAQAEQNLSMLPVIKSFSGGDIEAGRYRERTEAVRRLSLRQAALEGAITPTVTVVGAGVLLLLLGQAGWRIAEGELSTEQMVSLFLYGFVLIRPVGQLAQLYGSTMSARGALQRLGEALAAAPEQDTGTHVPERVAGELRFEGVDFGYPGRPPLFSGFDMRVAAGESVAITGANGAGKSTLAHLALRLVEPDAGRILLDAVDVRELPLATLRGRIGLVGQNVLLFNDTVAANIAYGRPGASEAEIREAAEAARAHEFVVGLREGYDTLVGDQGVRLSGGQKQRIALARALLADPAVLILDEATAMFDPDAEQAFITGSHALLRSRTVILITHRPASLALADRVLHLEGGRLEERCLEKV